MVDTTKVLVCFVQSHLDRFNEITSTLFPAHAEGQFARQPISLWSIEKHVKRIRQRHAVSALLPSILPLGCPSSSFSPSLWSYKVHVTPRKRTLAHERHRKEVYCSTRSLLRSATLCRIGASSRDQCNRPLELLCRTSDVTFKRVCDELQSVHGT